MKSISYGTKSRIVIEVIKNKPKEEKKEEVKK